MDGCGCPVGECHDKEDCDIVSLLRSIPVPFIVGPYECSTIGFYTKVAADKIEQLRDQLTTKDRQIADLQRLCGRAHAVLSENFDAYRGKDGYGPSNLEADLKKAAEGREVKDLRSLNDSLVKIANRQSGDIEKLMAERDKLRDALSRSRAQWIHSVNRNRCLEALGEDHD